MALHLYDAAEALAIIDELIAEHADLIEAAGGDIEAVPEIAELLAFAEQDFEASVERIGLTVRSMLAEAEGIKVEAIRLAVMQKRKENAAARLKGYLQRQLEGRGIQKVRTPLVRVRLQKNSQPAVSAISEAVIENLFAAGSPFADRKIVYALNRGAILAAEEAGEGRMLADQQTVEIVEGVFVKRGVHLRVE